MLFKNLIKISFQYFYTFVLVKVAEQRVELRINIGYCNAERYTCPPNEQCKY